MTRRNAILTVALTLGTASAASAQTFSTVCTATSAPRLAVNGSHLLVSPSPDTSHFLVLVSYFDAMRASLPAVERDFAFLKSKGVDGVRIFPLWIRDAGLTGAQSPGATLLDSTGRIRSRERWDHFAAVLGKAAACGMIVDVTFTRDMLNTISPFSVANYQGNPSRTSCAGGKGVGAGGLAEIACRLKGAAYSHVFVDIQNERNAGNPGMRLTLAEARGIRDAIKRVDPGRLVMMSHGGGDIVDALAAMREAKLDIVAFHEEQREGWFTGTAANVSALREAGLPIYIQEGPRATRPGERFRGARCDTNSPDDNPFLKAVVEARRAGASAWTFHTDAGFSLDTQSFQKEISACRQEVDFLDRFRAIVDRAK